jgi:hypothetical protein
MGEKVRIADKKSFRFAKNTYSKARRIGDGKQKSLKTRLFQ